MDPPSTYPKAESGDFLMVPTVMIVEPLEPLRILLRRYPCSLAKAIWGAGVQIVSQDLRASFFTSRLQSHSILYEA